jgi:hypothetical protein
MTLVSKREDQATSAAVTEAADVVLSFGASMMRAGNTASRTREWVEVVARNWASTQCRSVYRSIALASAAFFAALAIGLVALLVDQRLNVSVWR